MGILHCRSSVILLLACVAAVQGSPGSARLVTAPRAGIRGGPSRYGASEGSALGRRAPLSHRLPHASHTSAEHPTLDVENHVQVRRQASSKTGTAEVPAISEWGSYDEVVTVGTQQVLLTFDTGSQEFWVMTPQSQSDEVGSFSQQGPFTDQVTAGMIAANAASRGLTVSPLYDPSKDTMNYDPHVDPILSPNMLYGTGAANGTWTGSTIFMGDIACNQSFMAATWVDGFIMNDYSGHGVSGLVGLGPPKSSAAPQDQTFVGNLASVMAEPVFTVDLQSQGGIFTFGMIDESDYTGDIQYADIVAEDQPYWNISSKSIAWSANDAPLTASDTPWVLVDTGTTLTYFGKEDTEQYYKGVATDWNDEQMVYDVPCGRDPPSLVMTFGGGSASIDIPMQSIPYAYTNWTTGASETKCMGPIQYSPAIQSIILLGDTFFRGTFVVYNASKNANDRYSVGFAAKAGAS